MTQPYVSSKIKKWCDRNGWQDLFVEGETYYGFPPNAVLPVPVPIKAIKATCFTAVRDSIFIFSSALAFLGWVITEDFDHYGIKSPWALAHGSISWAIASAVIAIFRIIACIWFTMRLGKTFALAESVNDFVYDKLFSAATIFALLVAANIWVAFLLLV